MSNGHTVLGTVGLVSAPFDCGKPAPAKQKSRKGLVRSSGVHSPVQILSRLVSRLYAAATTYNRDCWESRCLQSMAL